MDKLRDIRDEIYTSIIQTQKEGYNNPLEPFDAYAARMKCKLHDMSDTYTKKILHGYEAILNKLTK